eukprot:6561110-Alexandrium_andersonii.AAC.1
MGRFPVRARHSEIGRTPPNPPELHEADLLRAGGRHQLRRQDCSSDVATELSQPRPGPVAVRQLGPRGTTWLLLLVPL